MNYYIKVDDKKYHIGKKSYKWNFIFNWRRIAKLTFGTMNEIKDGLILNSNVCNLDMNLVKNTILKYRHYIYDENDDNISFDKFWSMAVSLERDKYGKLKSVSDCISIDGYTGSYSSFN